MTDRSVDIATTVQNTGQLDLSIVSLIAQADIVVKLVMLLLLLASVWCWAIIIDKWKKFKRDRVRTLKFEKDYHSSKVFSALYDQVRNNQDNPMAAMFVAGMHELKHGVLHGISRPDESLKKSAQQRILFCIERVKNRTIERMEKNLIFLATVGSAAPFIGLFGTVWGIVNSFQSIAASQNTTLVVVAPGIAEALLATAIGLFAAIPAVIFYNIFSNHIRVQIGKMDDFSEELAVLLTQQMGRV